MATSAELKAKAHTPSYSMAKTAGKKKSGCKSMGKKKGK